MAKEKRTKPCSNCKKSKVKCVYSDSLPCDRCLKTGQAVNCQFIQKLPSLVLPEYAPSPPVPVPKEKALVLSTGPFDDDTWKATLENKINTFDNKLNDLVDIMKQQQKLLLNQQLHNSREHHRDLHSHEHHRDLHLHNSHKHRDLRQIEDSNHSQNNKESTNQPESLRYSGQNNKETNLIDSLRYLGQNNKESTNSIESLRHSSNTTYIDSSHHLLNPRFQGGYSKDSSIKNLLANPINQKELLANPINQKELLANPINQKELLANPLDNQSQPNYFQKNSTQPPSFPNNHNNHPSFPNNHNNNHFRLNEKEVSRENHLKAHLPELTSNTNLSNSSPIAYPYSYPKVLQPSYSNDVPPILPSLKRLKSGEIDSHLKRMKSNEIGKPDLFSLNPLYNNRQDPSNIHTNPNLPSDLNSSNLNYSTHPNTRSNFEQTQGSTSTQNSATMSNHYGDANLLHRSTLTPQDFRQGFLSKDEGRELFAFFNSNIAQQLFGFEISKISVDSVWNNCPILVCAICTIASIHHPILSRKSNQLQLYLHDLSSNLILKGKPKNEQDGFNTIVALILCSFWLSDSQMFTGLALQLAKEYGLNNPYTDNKENLKLWYLLYILDGQQSFTFNRQPLFNSNDFTFKNSRNILLNSDTQSKITSNTSKSIIKKRDVIESEKIEPDIELVTNIDQSPKFTDLRLVSQVEYNQAINEAFNGNAWELLAPSSFGIPSRSNMELDKWMVSWTVLLAPGNHGAVWSSKSTLIYYNFAKMSINSSTVRRIKINPNQDDSILPKWKDIKDEKQTVKPTVVEDDEDILSDEESSDDEEFVTDSEIMVHDDLNVSANIAVNAASTVLHLVTSDNDILQNLKYVPVHIHVMIYYAALLLLNPPLEANENNSEAALHHYTKGIDNLTLIKTLQRKIYSNLPIDTKFGDKLIGSLTDIVFEKMQTIKAEINEIDDSSLRNDLLNQVNAFHENDNNSYEMVDSSGLSSSGSTPKPEKISAWPGSHHGHP